MSDRNIDKGEEAGFGCPEYTLAIYIANRPPVDDYPSLDHLKPLVPGELAHIVAHTSNHWRKVFNVFAKFLYTFGLPRALAAGSWQSYRDQSLLRLGCHEALLFSAPDFSRANTVHIIAGKTYAGQLAGQAETFGLAWPQLEWIDAHFAINREHRVIVCPYLDYRQLSNERIDRLVNLVRMMREPVGIRS